MESLLLFHHSSRVYHWGARGKVIKRGAEQPNANGPIQKVERPVAIAREVAKQSIQNQDEAVVHIGGGLAQVLGSDAAVITPIQVAILLAIGVEHGTPISKAAAAAAELILPSSAAALGARHPDPPTSA